MVSLPPRPSVVISLSPTAAALWPWNPATMTTLPASISARTRARLDVRDAGLAVAAVRRDPGLRARQADRGDALRVERHREQGRGTGARRSRAGRRARAASGSSVTAAARPSSSSVVSPMALTTTTRSWPAARSRAIRRATRLMRSASATDEPPYFWTTRGAGIVAHSTARASRRPPGPPASGGSPASAGAPITSGDYRWSVRAGGRAVCFDLDSRPPIPPIAGGALDAERRR